MALDNLKTTKPNASSNDKNNIDSDDDSIKLKCLSENKSLSSSSGIISASSSSESIKNEIETDSDEEEENENSIKLHNPETRTALTHIETRLKNCSDYFQPTVQCTVCSVKFKNIVDLNKHKETNGHKMAVLLKDLSLHEDRNYEDQKRKLVVHASIEPSINQTNNDENVEFKFTNIDYESIDLQHLYWIDLKNNDDFMSFSTNFCFLPRQIKRQTPIVYHVPVHYFSSGPNLYKFVVQYKDSRQTQFISFYNFHITNRPVITLSINPIGHYFPEPVIRGLHRQNYKCCDSTSTENEKNLLKSIKDFQTCDKFDRLNADNYYDTFKMALQMEDEIESKKILKHDQLNVKVKCVRDLLFCIELNDTKFLDTEREFIRLWLSPMSLRMEAVVKNQEFVAKLKENGKDLPRKLPYFVNRLYGYIKKVESNTVYFELRQSLHGFMTKTNVLPQNELYFIRFMNDRVSVTLQHRALDYAKDHRIIKYLLPSIDNIQTNESDAIASDTIKWISELNDEQKIAVEHILSDSYRPYPYVLFGPPGTGKTKTLVEAIGQLIAKNNPNEHILVCATSNSACDEIAKRLLTLNSTDNIFRLYSRSIEQKTDTVPDIVLQKSNLLKRQHYYPSLKILYGFKVIVCTLTTAGRLAQGKIDSNHFTHVFVDESGSATESETLIAFAGVCSAEDKLNAKITLAGDPKQLGPIIQSMMAAKLGLDISMLERLMNHSLYKRNPTTNKFNEKYVTQLVKNYRSHETILKLSNEMFYENTLKTCANKDSTDYFLDTKFLISPKFPFIFHSVEGISLKEEAGTSLYNRVEINVVIEYLQKLLCKKSSRPINQTDIGIISPYRKQWEMIKETCNAMNWNNIQIGSVEIFQGQEKRIIIVSTVRSNTSTIGFLDNEKRLNVLLTRAKALLIIIGNPKTLSKDKYWSKVIQYCRNNSSIKE